MAKNKGKYTDEFGKNYRNRTIASIKAEITERTKIVNEKIKNTDKETLNNSYVKQAIEDLKVLSNSKTKNISANVSGTRTRESLIRQARELKAYENWDIYSEQGKQELRARSQKAFNSFKQVKGRENISESDWNSFVEALGALASGSKKEKVKRKSDSKKEALKRASETMYDLISSSKSSNDFVDAWQQASKEGKIRFVDIWKEIEEDKKSGKLNANTTFQIMEEFKKRVSEAGIKKDENEDSLGD